MIDLLVALLASLALGFLLTSLPSLSNWRWYRRWKGGHWENWWVDTPVNAFVWHRVTRTLLTALFRSVSLASIPPPCPTCGWAHWFRRET